MYGLMQNKGNAIVDTQELCYLLHEAFEMRTKKIHCTSSARKLENSYLWNINMNNIPISCLLLHTPGDS